MFMRCSRPPRAFLRIVLFLSFLLLLLMYLKNFVSPSLSKEEQRLENMLRKLENRVITYLGYLGEPAHLKGKKKEDGKQALKKIGFNTVLSDSMPLNRTLRDVRHMKCGSFNYNSSLKASIIIVFYNELLSAILRTVWSIMSQTPSHLLHEIILVDDCSTDGDLYSLLEHYFRTRLKDHTIHLVRLKHRVGLIKARLGGARVATGDVLIFLDSLCEVMVGWSDPILSRIEEDRTAVLVPWVDSIDTRTLEYIPMNNLKVGGFSWSGNFMWIDAQDPDDIAKLTPIRTPTMDGNLFAIERKYFWEIGSYDEQMDGWGGETLEMSFRIWQCGGRLETVPCSRVGRISRKSHPLTFPDKTNTHLGINMARVAHIWMDDYKRLFFMHHPNLENNLIIGNLAQRQQLRQRLNCKSFKWYLHNVYPEKYVADDVRGSGQVKNKFNMCLDTMQRHTGPLGLYPCNPKIGLTQFFGLTFKGQLRNEYYCAEAHINMTVSLMECRKDKQEQYWEYFVNIASIYNPLFQKCLSSNRVGSGKGLIIEDCKREEFQNWTFTNLNETAFVL